MRRLLNTVIYLCITAAFILPANHLQAQTQQKSFNYSIQLQGTASSNEYNPFWLYSNTYGVVDYTSPSSNAIFDFHKNPLDSTGLDYGFGTTLVGRYSDNKTLFFNQLYGTLAYKNFQIKGGRFFETIGTVDETLSMGSLATSANATPIPKVKLGFPTYTNVPFTNGYVEFKSEIAHGWFEKDRMIESPWLHQKYAYLRFGGDFAFRPYIGLVHEATWAGTDNEIRGDLDDSFSDFLRVFAAQSAGDESVAGPGETKYKLGDHRGIWDFGFNLSVADFDILAYRQYIYNDKDGLKLQNPDGLTGLSIELPHKNQQLVTGILWEYLYSKKQSGPLPPFGRDGPGGRDNYYNNFLYRSGWTYEGRVIGNPLFLTAYDPQLGTVANYQLDLENRYGIANNRIVAHHFGIEGKLSSVIDYKLLATWSRNYGTYYDRDLFEETGIRTDFLSNPEQWSFLATFSYQPFDPLQINLSLAGDTGELYEDRIGVMLGIKLMGSSPF